MLDTDQRTRFSHRGRAKHVVVFLAGAAAVLALGVLVSVGIAGVMMEPGAEEVGGLTQREAVQIGVTSAVVAAISSAAASLAIYLVRQPT